jgi:uncharacterized protein YlxW (UPF0749 family)
MSAPLETPPTEGTTDVRDATTAPHDWAAIRAALIRPPSRGQWVVALLLLMLGFTLAVQVQTTQQDALGSARTSDLVRILDDLSAQRERLSAEESRLRANLAALVSGADQAQAAREATRERLESLRVLAGTVPVHGPGVVVTVTDPQGVLDSGDLLDAVQELRDSGAEAIAIDGVRVVATTPLVDTPEGIAVGDQVVDAPYEITAIGDPDTLAAGLSFPGGVVESVREAGASTAIVERQEVRIDAVP